MARRPEYDRTEVLDAAMRTFWHKGYESTSVRDLVDACGLSTRSMYDGFGDKARFFDAVLGHYHACILTPVLEVFAEHRGLAALRSFVDLLSGSGSEDGCLYVNTGAEREVVAADSLRRVDDYGITLRSLIRQKLLEAHADGEFDGDPEIRTAQLAVSVTGFLVTLRSGGSPSYASIALRAVLDDIERD